MRREGKKKRELDTITHVLYKQVLTFYHTTTYQFARTCARDTKSNESGKTPLFPPPPPAPPAQRSKKERKEGELYILKPEPGAWEGGGRVK